MLDRSPPDWDVSQPQPAADAGALSGSTEVEFHGVLSIAPSALDRYLSHATAMQPPPQPPQQQHALVQRPAWWSPSASSAGRGGLGRNFEGGLGGAASPQASLRALQAGSLHGSRSVPSTPAAARAAAEHADARMDQRLAGTGSWLR